MQKRYMSIWFSTLLTDWIRIKRPALSHLPLVFSDKAGNLQTNTVLLRFTEQEKHSKQMGNC
ncbi:hypothetical protein [Pedobacter sp. PF22-3]|uniref:hypothetical protein n=1 Tax=Pedobacter sp. PF22-3 TaxID=2994467 RepID=UPI0022482E70|nr:hypothetical protein [Pedobacter sp. PF22-3]